MTRVRSRPGTPVHGQTRQDLSLRSSFRVNLRIAVCCRSARIRRSHDLTVNVDELCNR